MFIRTEKVAFVATWDDTRSYSSIDLTNAELKEFTTSADSLNGKYIISILINNIVNGASEVRREFVMATDDLGFKLAIRFEICRVPSVEKRLQVKENLEQPSQSMYRIYA